MSGISTHVLDTATGRPASGVAITLEARGTDGGWRRLGAGSTDADGRLRDLLPDGALATGVHRMTFDTGAYFAATGSPHFYPHVTVVFDVADAGQHHHIPLLLSPFGYSTYRGS